MATNSDSSSGSTFDIWPVRDLVVAYKNLLKPPREGEHDCARRQSLPPGLPDALKARSSANLYPFTRGLELGNDGLGYGEIVTVSLVRVEATAACVTIEPHSALRTRSGQTPLEPEPHPIPIVRDKLAQAKQANLRRAT